MEVIILLTIFCNAGVFAFTLNGLSENILSTENQLQTFLITILFFLIFKLIAQTLISDIPENFKILKNRQNRIKTMLLNSEFQTSSINVRAGVYMNLNSNVRDSFNEY